MNIETLKKYWWVGAIILVVIVVLFFASCKPGDIPFTQKEWEHEANDALNDLGIPNEFTNFQYHYTTPGGIKIHSVVEVPPAFLGYADEGRQRQIERFHTVFPQFADSPETTILLIHPNYGFNPDGTPSGPPCVTEVNDPGSPCIYVSGQKAAGATIGGDDRWTELDKVVPIVMAEQSAQNWTKVEWFKAVVHNEREHVSAWRNRTANPQNIYYHFQGEFDVHPFVWGDQPAGLKGSSGMTCAVK